MDPSVIGIAPRNLKDPVGVFGAYRSDIKLDEMKKRARKIFFERRRFYIDGDSLFDVETCDAYFSEARKGGADNVFSKFLER